VHAEDRRQLIADELRRRGRVSVNHLAAAYGVTGETVRRDLVELEQRGVLRRIHGGALAPERMVIEPAVGERAGRMATEKERIADAALTFLPGDEGTVLIDAGTTTAALVERFPTDRRLTVVTNAIPLAMRLATRPLVTVIVVGGRLRARTLANVDELAIRTIDDLRVDVAFIATNGISERGCSTPDPSEAAVKRAMVGSADRSVVLADRSKFGQEHFVRFAELADIDVVVTDHEVDQTDLLALQVAGIDLVTA
jgi:DeoR family fructose operon transcriptional repressor